MDIRIALRNDRFCGTLIRQSSHGHGMEEQETDTSAADLRILVTDARRRVVANQGTWAWRRECYCKQNSLLGVQVSDRNLAGKSKIKANNQKTGETGRFPPVGFASESGHVHCTRRCPLWANIRHCRLPHRSMRWAAIASSFHSKPSPGTSGTCSMPFLISYGLCRTGSAQSCHSSQCADSVTRMT